MGEEGEELEEEEEDGDGEEEQERWWSSAMFISSPLLSRRCVDWRVCPSVSLPFIHRYDLNYSSRLSCDSGPDPPPLATGHVVISQPGRGPIAEARDANSTVTIRSTPVRVSVYMGVFSLDERHQPLGGMLIKSFCWCTPTTQLHWAQQHQFTNFYFAEIVVKDSPEGINLRMEFDYCHFGTFWFETFEFSGRHWETAAQACRWAICRLLSILI